ncbi:MAG: tripartite tricarboxylate transporter substrate binding protein [Deltaproteobacteria bacterium]|nr:tripartite tricarboxylate transporter substrate binding protein [Deltaproteobacteria bacterium]
MKKRTSVWFVSLAALLVFGFSPSVPAADYPVKPVQLIVPYSPGGSLDRTARIIAKHAEKYLGQKVVVVNRTGASGSVGFTAIAQAKPDGYVLGMGATPLIQHHLLLEGVTYTYKSFTPVVMCSYDNNTFTVKAGSPIDKPWKEFLAYMKAHPNEIPIGLGGHWSSLDLARAAFELATGTSFRRVQFKGGAKAVASVLGGHTMATTAYQDEIYDHVKLGKLRILTFMSEKRMANFPDVPTMKELGYDVVMGVWRGVIAPNGLPDDVKKKVIEAFDKTIKDPALKADFEKGKVPYVYKNAEEFGKIRAQGHEKITKIVQTIKARSK